MLPTDIPIPPCFASLGLPLPVLTDHSYLLHFQRRHLMMLNGEQQYTSSVEEVESKHKSTYEQSELNSTVSISDGRTAPFNLLNLSQRQQCGKCHNWIVSEEMQIHATYHASRIMEGLLLGDRVCSMSAKELFQRNAVTHIVNAASELANYFQKDTKLKYLKLGLLDLMEEDLIGECQKAAHFIDEAIRAGGTVFVHCALGKSRSASAILVYFMLYRKIGFEEGLAILKKARPIVQPNPGYIRQLLSYEQTLHLPSI